MSSVTFVLGYALCWAETGHSNWRTLLHSNAAQVQTVPLVIPSKGATDTQTAFINVSKAVRPAIVSIRSRMTVKQPSMPDLELGPFGGSLPFNFRMSPPTTEVVMGTGSGFIVRQDGYILTNDHVVAGADKVTVRLDDGREFTGVAKRDYRSDIALIKIPADHLPTLNLADSSQVEVGEWAIAFGTPFGLRDTMTVGVVSAVSRETVIGGSQEDARYYPNLVQTDASINPGNSGGPLLDIYGRVIGINAAIDSPSGGNVGIGFAIPANTAKFVMDQLITKGVVTRGFLGLVPEELSPEQMSRYGVKAGALVTVVTDGSPADKAGLKVEDVVTGFDGKPINNESDLRGAVARTPPGTKVSLDILRDGRSLRIAAELTAAPIQELSGAVAQEGINIGIQLADLTPDIANRMGLNASATGLVITDVRPGSQASEAGMQPGDVLIRINRTAIRSAFQARELIANMKHGEVESFVIQRRNSRLLVSFSIQ
jgi:serine protease Do